MHERPGTRHRSSCNALRMRLTSPPLRLCGSQGSAMQRCAPPSRSALGPTSLQTAVQSCYLRQFQTQSKDTNVMCCWY